VTKVEEDERKEERLGERNGEMETLSERDGDERYKKLSERKAYDYAVEIE
jgi:hypothetical protein